jgi:cobalt-zinc-cadmium efflux system outer membrane protein
VIQRDYIRDFNQVSTLVAAPIPLFNRNRGNIINAEGLLRQQQHEYRRTELALADQLANSFQQYLSARNQVDHLREILPRTQENLNLTTEAFRQGQTGFGFMRVLDAEQTFYQTKTSYIDALTSLHKLAIEISGLELTGGLNPTEVGTALQTAVGPETGVRNVLLQQAQQQNAGTLETLPGSIQSTIGGP